MRDKINKSIRNNVTKLLTRLYINDKPSFDNPYELDSCYNGSPMTIFTLIIDNLTFISRDLIDWSAQGFGGLNINEDLTDHQEYSIICKFATNTDLHKNLLIKRYNRHKTYIEEVIEIKKELVGKQLVDAKGNPKGYYISEESLEKSENYLKFIIQCLIDLEHKLPSEVDIEYIKYQRVLYGHQIIVHYDPKLLLENLYRYKEMVDKL